MIGTGCKDIIIQEIIEKTKKSDTELKLTYGYSDDDLYNIANETITNSKELYQKCSNDNVSCFDKSIGRYKTDKKNFKYIEKEW